MVDRVVYGVEKEEVDMVDTLVLRRRRLIELIDWDGEGGGGE